MKEEVAEDSLSHTKEKSCHPSSVFKLTHFLVFVAVLPRVSQLYLWMWMSLLNPMRSLPFGFCGTWSSVGGQQGYSQQQTEDRYCQPSLSAACDGPCFNFILLLLYFSSEGQLRCPWLWASSTLITGSVRLCVNWDLAKLVLKAVPVLKALAQASVDLYLYPVSFWALVRIRTLLIQVEKRKFYLFLFLSWGWSKPTTSEALNGDGNASYTSV